MSRKLEYSDRGTAGAVLCACLIITTIACNSKPASAPEGQTQSAPIETIRISRMDAVANGALPNAVSKTDGGWRIVSAHQWGYAGIVPFNGFGKAGVSGTVEVKLKIAKGRAGVGLITSANEIIQEQFGDAGEADLNLTFKLGSANLEALVVRSAAPHGTLSEALVERVDYVLPASPVPGAASLAAIARVDPAATLETGPPVRVVSAPRKYGYAANVPLRLARSGTDLVFIRVRGRIGRGRMGMGVLDNTGKAFQTERYYDSAAESRDYFIAIPAPESAASLVFRTDRDESAEMAIEQITVYRTR